MRFKTKNENIQWEETDYIKVHNFPSSHGTYSYITKVYRQYEKGKFGWESVEGDPIYFHNMTPEQRSLAIIMGTAQNGLNYICGYESFLKPIEDEIEF